MLPVFFLPRFEFSSSEESLIETVFFASTFAGMLAGGTLADIVGRRRCLLVTVPVSFFGGLSHFMCAKSWQFMLIRVVTGLACGAQLVSLFVLLMELTPPLQRGNASSVFFLIGWTGSILLMVIVAYETRDVAWQWLILAGIIPSPLGLLWLPESPLFLLGKDDPVGALEVLQRVAQANGQLLGEVQLKLDKPRVQDETAWGGSFLAQIRDGWRWMVPLVLCSSLAWFGSTATYYGVVLWPLSANQTLYASNAVGALIEVPIYLFAPSVAIAVGPVHLWCAFLVCCAATWFVLCVTGVNGTLGTMFLLLSRFLGTGATTICYNAVSEAMPASLRGTGFGIANSCGRLGTIASPALVHMMPSQGASAAVLACLAGCAALCAFGLVRVVSRRPDIQVSPGHFLSLDADSDPTPKELAEENRGSLIAEAAVLA